MIHKGGDLCQAMVEWYEPINLSVWGKEPTVWSHGLWFLLCRVTRVHVKEKFIQTLMKMVQKTFLLRTITIGVKTVAIRERD